MLGHRGEKYRPIESRITTIIAIPAAARGSFIATSFACDRFSSYHIDFQYAMWYFWFQICPPIQGALLLHVLELPDMNTGLLAYASLAVAMMIVGSTVVVGKIITSNLPVFLASGLSLLIASIVFGVLALRKKETYAGLSKKDVGILFLQAFFGTFIYRILFLYGLRFSSANEAGIILSTTPAVIGLLSYLFLKEKLGSRKIIGIVFSVIGVLLINAALITETGQSRFYMVLGLVSILGCVVGQALFSILPKALSQSVSSFSVASLTTFMSLALFLPFSLYQAFHFDFSSVGIATWVSLLYYGLFATVIAYLLWFRGLAFVDASTSGIFTAVVPVSALIFSYFVLHEQISPAQAVGTVCVIAGIVFVQLNGKRAS